MNERSSKLQDHTLQTSIGLFSDPHYAQLVYSNRYCKDSVQKLRQCIDTFNNRHLETVVNLGDFIDKADDKETEFGYLATIREVYEGFNGERHYVIGNHDVATFTKPEFLTSCGTLSPTPYYSFDYGALHCIILDSNCHRDGRDFSAGDFEWDNAWVSDTQINWLRDDLEASKEKPSIVFCHGNLDGRFLESELDPHVVKNSAAVRSILEQAGTVKAVIQGHYHPGLYTKIQALPYIGLRAMVVGEGMTQNAYAILTYFKDGTIDIEGFGQQPSIHIEPIL